jgi:hypothetical protein
LLALSLGFHVFDQPQHYYTRQGYAAIVQGCFG